MSTDIGHGVPITIIVDPAVVPGACGLATSAYDLAAIGTNVGTNAYNLAQTAGTSASSAYAIACAGTNVGTNAYNLALEAWSLASIGTNVGTNAYDLALSAYSLAATGTNVGTNAYDLAQAAYDLAAIGTNVGTNAYNLASSGSNVAWDAYVLASNVIVNTGTGSESVYTQTSNGTVQFKTLAAGSNITITNAANTLTITSSGGGASTPDIIQIQFFS